MLQILKEHVEQTPEKIALYMKETRLTFFDVGQEVKKKMAYFKGVLPHGTKRVGLWSHNSIDMYLTILTLWSLDKEIVFLNTHLSLGEVKYQLQDGEVEMVVSDGTHPVQMTQTVQVTPLAVKHIKNNEGEMPEVEKASLTSIMYTSGTTGQPKGVVQHFQQHLASANATKENMNVLPSDTWGCAVPLFHISGLSIMLRQLVLGIGIVLYERFDENQVTADLMSGRVTIMSVVTKMLETLLSVYPEVGYHATFQSLLLGGGPVSKALLEICRDRQIPVIQSYGMTETCSQIVALNHQDALRKIGSVGRPLKGVQLRLVRSETQEEVLQGEIGEIEIKADQVVTNYLNDRAWHQTKWTMDGWFKTGDMGYLDEEGYLYVISRLSELIISGGENIYPAEVEGVLEQLSDVTQVTVMGESNDFWGAVPIAFYIGERDISIEEMKRCVSETLAPYKQPKKWHRCHSFPLTASGKVAKHRLMTEEREVFLWS